MPAGKRSRAGIFASTLTTDEKRICAGRTATNPALQRRRRLTLASWSNFWSGVSPRLVPCGLSAWIFCRAHRCKKQRSAQFRLLTLNPASAAISKLHQCVILRRPRSDVAVGFAGLSLLRFDHSEQPRFDEASDKHGLVHQQRTSRGSPSSANVPGIESKSNGKTLPWGKTAFSLYALILKSNAYLLRLRFGVSATTV